MRHGTLVDVSYYYSPAQMKDDGFSCSLSQFLVNSNEIETIEKEHKFPRC